MHVHSFATAALLLLANPPAVRIEGRPAGTATSRFENELAGVKLGSKSGELVRTFPTLYRHRLAMGEILYEACDQKELIVFNFTAEPWSPEFITYISVRRESDETVCRDSTGALPDLGLSASTPRGVRIGDSAGVVLAKYGKPDEESSGRNGESFFRYRIKGSAFTPEIHNSLLVFTVREGRVRAFAVSGDVPGAKTPWQGP
jgi:hypothetical protein